MTKSQLEWLLQRMDKQHAASAERKVRQPPNGSSASSGRRLAELCGPDQDDDDDDDDDKILKTLCHEYVNPSIPHAFLECLVNNWVTQEDDPPVPLQALERLSRWILRCEELRQDEGSGGDVTLTKVIQAFSQVFLACHLVSNNSKDDVVGKAHSLVRRTFGRLQTSHGRMGMLRACTTMAFTSSWESSFDRTTLSTVLEPFLVSFISNWGMSNEERLLFLQGVWRESWQILATNNELVTTNGKVKEASIATLLHKMAKALLMLQQGLELEAKERRPVSTEIAHAWLVELVGMLHVLTDRRMQSRNGLDDDDAAIKMVVHQILSLLVEDILPTALSFQRRASLESMVQQLIRIRQSLGPFVVTRRVFFRLAVEASTSSSPNETNALLTMLLDMGDTSDRFVRGIMHSLACLYGTVPTCQTVADELHTRSLATSSSSTSESRQPPMGLVDLFQTDDDVERILECMKCSLGNIVAAELPPADQKGALLIGTALLYSFSARKDCIREYLRTVLQSYPHMGIDLLPVLLCSIQNASSDENGELVLNELEFLCDALVHDPHCAQEVWNIVGITMTQTDVALSTRTVAIRVFPLLCARNKRLYRRILDTIGTFVESRDPQLRLAVVVTIHDLAKEDLIRDVSDVIGWVQTFLGDEDHAVVHFAILSLHWLIIAQELDFTLVMKVLNKRLCAIGDVSELLKLPSVVLEALVLLLGDGECDERSEGGAEEGDSRLSPASLSPQVTAAVGALIELAHYGVFSEERSDTAYLRVRLNIYRALSRYSLEALGVDEDEVRTSVVNASTKIGAPTSTEAPGRYDILRRITEDSLSSSILSEPSTEEHPGAVLASKLAGFEEEILGSSLWQKRAPARPIQKRKKSVPKGIVSMLPDSQAIRLLHDDEPTSVTALALLMSVDDLAMDDIFELASDMSRSSWLSLHIPFLIQSWVNAMGKIWARLTRATDGSISDSIKSVLSELRGWKDILGEVDHGYLASAAFCLFIPDMYASDEDSCVVIDLSNFVTATRNEIFEVFTRKRFQDRDTGAVCVALASVRAILSSDLSFVEHAVSQLERTLLSNNGGESTAGACCGLALIANSLSLDIRTSSGRSQTSGVLVRRILSLFVDQLNHTLLGNSKAATTLAVCIKSGKGSPDLDRVLSGIDGSHMQDIPDMLLKKAQSALLGIGICATSLSTLEKNLQRCVYLLLRKLSWDAGKGLALANVFIECKNSGCVHEEDEQDLALEMKSLEEEGAGSTNAEDARLVLASLRSREQLHVDADLIQDDPLMAFAISIASFPCLGSGAPLFCSHGSLLPTTTKDDVSSMLVRLNACLEAPSSEMRMLATVLLGYFAFMKWASTSKERVWTLLETPDGLSVGGDTAIQGYKVSPSSLPDAQSGTVVAKLIDAIKAFADDSIMTKHRFSDMREVLMSLEVLSLPAQFVHALIEPFLLRPQVEMKSAATSLLISQFRGRRRAAFDGRDFITFAVHVAQLPASSFDSLLGMEAKIMFVSSLGDLLLKVSSDSVVAILSKLWEKSKSDSSSAITYLSSIKDLLYLSGDTAMSRRNLSPRTKTLVIDFVSQQVLRSLSEGALKEEPRVLEGYVDCLRCVSPSELADRWMFDSTRTSLSYSQTYCTIRLYGQQYFEASDEVSSHITRAIAWFIQHQKASSSLALCNLVVAIATAAATEETFKQKETLMFLLEALHVEGLGTCSMELIAMLVAVFAPVHQREGSFTELLVTPFFRGLCFSQQLSQRGHLDMAHLTLSDLSANICAYGHSAQISDLVWNRVWRIRKAGIASGLRAPLESILLRSRLEDTDQEDFLALASSFLQDSQTL